MTDSSTLPKRLYKYRGFGDRTLSMLVDDIVYFADPTTFNDPLDTKPKLQTDLDADSLERILASLVEERTSAEMSAAAKTIRYGGPKTLDHIARQSRKAAERLLAETRYNATDPETTVADPAQFILGRYVEAELLRRYDKGIFSLAERAKCPLMWSHYADQHRGICLGYSVPDAAMVDIHKIKYGGSRMVQASAVAAMLAGDEEARLKVDGAVFLKKAKAWAYEREWRLIGPRGQQDSPLELEEVIFGMRCDPAVKYSVIRTLAKRDRPVCYYEIGEQSVGFILMKRRVDIDDFAASLPKRCRSMDGMFKDETDPETQN